MAGMLERLTTAMNAHDAAGMASLFAVDYRSTQPAHPGRDFTGRAQVLANWTSVFEGVPDFESVLLASSVDTTGETDAEWGEWDWHGRHTDGDPFAMRGMAVMVVRDELIAEGRLYMEAVDTSGGDIDAAVEELYQPPGAPDGT